MRRALLGLTCVALAACPARGDPTPLIAVHPHPGLWEAVLADRTLARARVHVMKDGEQLGGPSAIGRPGDLLLENDEVAFVVDQLGSSAGFAESGGNLVDAADARVRKDDLGQVFTYFGKFPRQGVYDALGSGTSEDGSAWIEARGRELSERQVVVSTRYTLHAPDRALLLETTLENTGDHVVALDSLGDAVQWGGAEKTAPGLPAGFHGASSGPYLGGVGRFVSYAMTSTEGSIDGVSGRSWTDTSVQKNVVLAAGAKATYARVFLVGERPDTTSLVGELALAAGRPVGEVAVRIAGGPLGTGETVQLLPEGSREPLTLASPFVARVPVGRYGVALAGAPGSGAGAVEVNADTPAQAEVRVEARAALEMGCRRAEGASRSAAASEPAGAPMPCKLTVEGLGPTPDPHFGPGTAAGPALRQATTAGDPVRVLVTPGTYRITASRGPEYALDAAEVELKPGTHRSVWLAPSRVVDTRGYLACDFHQHTMLGADAATSTRDRVIANAAEGVEVAVATEHNLVADLEPLVRDLGLQRELVALSGDELTSDANPRPWGHANAWPMVPVQGKPRGGAPPVRDRSAREVFDELRGTQALGDLVLQINHPRSGSTGYFDLMGFDAARGEATSSAYVGSFDAVEVWNGRNTLERDRVLDDWRGLLRAAHPVTATADTDTHGVVGQEAGYPRTYVRVADDEHLDGWNEARTADLVRGVKTLRDVVLTDGPMLRVSANGAPVGGIARGRLVTVKVHVESAPWVEVDTVRVVRAREGASDEPRRVALRPRAGVAGAAGVSGPRVGVADVELVLRFDADDAFFVVASGHKPMGPALDRDSGSGSGSQSADELLPWAMTGAIWVDANGDGESLGRK